MINEKNKEKIKVLTKCITCENTNYHYLNYNRYEEIIKKNTVYISCFYCRDIKLQDVI